MPSLAEQFLAQLFEFHPEAGCLLFSRYSAAGLSPQESANHIAQSTEKMPPHPSFTEDEISLIVDQLRAGAANHCIAAYLGYV